MLVQGFIKLLSYPKIFPSHFTSQAHPSINSSGSKWTHTLLNKQPTTRVFASLQEKSSSDNSNGLHNLSYASKNRHVNFQDLIQKIAHPMTQMINNPLVDLKVKLC